MPDKRETPKPRFCSECGTRLMDGARFCHICGVVADGGASRAQTAQGISPTLKWGLPAAAIIALVAITFFRLGARGTTPVPPDAVTLGAGGMRAPDISAMSPAERADRLFNQVMRLSSEGKEDSALFFAPMALAAYDAITPPSAHSRYDVGLIALVTGDMQRASAEIDAILNERPTHLLGLVLAAKVADAQGDSAAARSARQKLLVAEQAERAAGLPEYADHDADLRAAVAQARTR